MAASSAGNTIREMYIYQGRKCHTGSFEGRKARTSHLRRQMIREKFYDEDGWLLFHWEPRGKLIDDADCVFDPDWFDYRARHSTGWKEHKHRYQWEHNVREKEKHQKSRARRALRRGESLFV